MTSIRDISNKIIKIHDDYFNSRKEMNNILDEYNRRNKLSYVSNKDRINSVYKLVIEYFKAQDEVKYLEYKFRHSRYLTGSHIHPVKLSKTKLRSLHPETCGICMEHHTYRTMVTTSCRHHFGKKCFSNWIDTCFVNYKDVSCVLCRNTNFTITRYISKKHK